MAAHTVTVADTITLSDEAIATENTNLVHIGYTNNGWRVTIHIFQDQAG